MAQEAAQWTVGSAEAYVQPRDPALPGLRLLAQFHGVPVDPAQLAHQFGGTGEPFDETALLLAAKQLGLKAKITAQPAERMAMATLPALALRPDGEHFIVAKVSEDTVLIHDLAFQRARVMPLDEFRRLYDGRDRKSTRLNSSH